MDIDTSLSEQIGKRMCLSVLEEDYVGTISEVNMGEGKITLIDILQLSNQNKIESQIFRIKDISNHRILESACQSIFEERQVLDFPSHIQDLLPDEFIVIEDIDSEYHNAICHLERQDMIGISVQGSNISRYSSFQWLCLSTPSYTFIFDILNLGMKAFTEGLRHILENNKIQKIIHDCREPSDCLYHQFGVKLANVYDTQVADFFAIIQKSPIDKISREIRSLNDCLKTYLKIHDNYLPELCDTIDFDERPLNVHIKEYLIKSVIYLRLMKKEIDFEIRVPFRRCVDMYLQSVQKLNDRELELQPPKLETIPNEMMLEVMRVLKISEDFLKPDHSSRSYLKKQKDPYHKYAEDCKKYETKKISKKSPNFSDINPEQPCYIDANGFDKSEIVYYLMSKMLNYKSTSTESNSSKDIKTSCDNDVSSDFNQTTASGSINKASEPKASLTSDYGLKNCEQSVCHSMKSNNTKDKKFQNLFSANIALSKRKCFSDNGSIKDKIGKNVYFSNESHKSYNETSNIMKCLTKENNLSSKSSISTGLTGELLFSSSSSMKNSDQPSKFSLYRKLLANDAISESNISKTNTTTETSSKQLQLPVCSKTAQNDNENLKVKQSPNATSLESNTNFSFKKVDSTFISLVSNFEVDEEDTRTELKTNITNKDSDLNLPNLNPSANLGKINYKKDELKDIDSNFYDLATSSLSSDKQDFINCQKGISKTPIPNPIDSDDWTSDEETPSKPSCTESDDQVSGIFETGGDDPYKKLREAFSSFRPSEEDHKRVFVPAGM